MAHNRGWKSNEIKEDGRTATEQHDIKKQIPVVSGDVELPSLAETPSTRANKFKRCGEITRHDPSLALSKVNTPIIR